ncbi:MAG: diguanylate cyclase [Campylobacterales bacterium]|nr:diguanylate cyclase [Campylobacterales bacterium]
MTVNQIIKSAIERLKSEGKMLTPDAYSEAFCIEAKKAGIIVEDCSGTEKFFALLDKNVQQEIKQYRVKTVAELIRFLISKLNRMQPSQCAETLDALRNLTKRVLQSIEVLHNAQASELSNKTIALLDRGGSASEIEQIRQSWINFLTLYDDTFLYKLSKLGKVYPSDLQKTVESLEIGISTSGAPSSDLGRIATLMIASFVPSIASSVNDKIATLSDNLRKDPKLLTMPSIEAEIKEIIKLRIALDKSSVKEMVAALDTILDKLSMQLIDLIERSDISTTEIQQIKRDLIALEADKESDFKTAHKKLFTIAVALEERTELLRGDLKLHNEKVVRLSTKVAQLEAELQKAQKASREDFLTKLFNKRALEEYMQIKEGEFARYGRNYSLAFFDLDHFKSINDTFGHDAGDAVLAGFAKMLKQECRNVDIIGRFGGEEFVALLSDTDLEGALIFANKVREHVAKTRFLYKGERIDVTVSAGVAQRINHTSLKAVLGSADEHLYSAKRNGRNRVEPQK